jgi:hypothetical protein
MEGPMFENTIELHTRANHKGNINQVPERPLSCCEKHIKYGKGEDTYLKIKFPNPFLSQEAYQITKEEDTYLEHHQVPKPFLITRSISNKEKGRTLT